MKTRPPKEPKQRSGASKIIWKSKDGKRQVTAVDLDSVTESPCKLVLNTSSGSLSDTGLNNLERELLFEFTAKSGTLPKWATEEAQEKRDATKKAWLDYQDEQQRLEHEALREKVEEGKSAELAGHAVFLREMVRDGPLEGLEDDRLLQIANLLENIG